MSTILSLECGDEQADVDGTAGPVSRDLILRREYSFFPVQLTTSKIGNLYPVDPCSDDIYDNHTYIHVKDSLHLATPPPPPPPCISGLILILQSSNIKCSQGRHSPVPLLSRSFSTMLCKIQALENISWGVPRKASEATGRK